MLHNVKNGLRRNEMKQKFTLSKLNEYIYALRTMEFDSPTSEIRISDGIIYITDVKNNKSATIADNMLSITVYDTEINEKGE